MKKSFNEKVFELRTQKIKLIHDYKQFKFDINMIQKELNDPEIITPSDFPEVLIDESIDVRKKSYSKVLLLYKVYIINFF